jgi:hypothetical protein
MLKTLPWPANQVSVHPPLSQMRMGATELTIRDGAEPLIQLISLGRPWEITGEAPVGTVLAEVGRKRSKPVDPRSDPSFASSAPAEGQMQLLRSQPTGSLGLGVRTDSK